MNWFQWLINMFSRKPAAPQFVAATLIINAVGKILEAQTGEVKTVENGKLGIAISDLPIAQGLLYETVNWAEVPKHFKARLEKEKIVSVQWNQIKGYLK